MNQDTNPVQEQTILVVEDEALVRMDISDALRNYGYHVLEAASADDALKLLAQGMSISLVFTDIRMPGKFDGFDVARFAAEHGVPVLLTSGHIHSSEVPQGMRPLVSKPYTHTHVLHLIDRKLRET